MTPEEERDNALADLARLRAGLAVGLSPEQSARLHGATAEELTADATAFATELGLVTPPAPEFRSGGNRGGNVSGHTAGSVAAGADLYRQRHGSPDDTQRTAQTGSRTPFTERTYS